MNDYKEKESPLVTGQTFIKYFYTIMPLDHADVNAHWHQHMELILIAKGSIPITLENATITAKKGDLLILHRTVFMNGTAIPTPLSTIAYN